MGHCGVVGNEGKWVKNIWVLYLLSVWGVIEWDVKRLKQTYWTLRTSFIWTDISKEQIMCCSVDEVVSKKGSWGNMI